MKTSRKSVSCPPALPRKEAGNAMIYVLIAIVLFAALSLIVARQGDNSESGALDNERSEIAATQIIQTSMQLKQGVDQMLYSGSEPDELDFVTPDDEPAFSTAPNVHKVFHPAGGGLILQPVPVQGTNEVSTTPPARWYIGRFINIEWTSTAQEDVILTAHQLSEPVCRAINQKLLGDPTPLVMTPNPRALLIDGSVYSAANPLTWQTVDCPNCEDVISGCVEGTSEAAGNPTIYSFYSIIISR